MKNLDPAPAGENPPPENAPARLGDEPRILASSRHGAPTIPGLAGSYQVRRLIGRGSMASVYLAEQVSMARRVALKILSPELAPNPDFVDRFLREARVAARLNHPNIVSAIDFGEVDSRFFLAMELVEGRTLSAILAESGPLPEKEAAEIGWRMLQALAHAARHNVVHRDVKPANIIIRDDDGDVKLTDFGLAVLLDKPDSASVQRRTVGTPHYMAPEQIEGGKLDWRADQYSLGASLYEALTGRKPFPGHSVSDILRRRFFEMPVPAWKAAGGRVGRGFSSVVARMLARSPDARYQSFPEILEDFDLLRRGRRPLHAVAGADSGAGGKRPAAGGGALGRIREFLARRRRSWLASSSLAVLAALILFAAAKAGALMGPEPPPHWRGDLAEEAERPGRDSGADAREKWLEAWRLILAGERTGDPEALRAALGALRQLTSRRDLSFTAYAAAAGGEMDRLEAELAAL